MGNTGLVRLLRNDTETYTHSIRVAEYAKTIAHIEGLDTDLMEEVGYLHDIGKYFVPEQILHKKEELTENERKIINMHPYLGYLYLRALEVPESECQIILYHHNIQEAEKQLSNEDVLYTKILATCDIFDALTSNRSYRDALSRETAFKIMSTEKNASADIMETLRCALG